MIRTEEYVDPKNDTDCVTRDPLTGNPWEDLAIALDDQLTFFRLNGRLNVRIIDRITHIREAIGEWEETRERIGDSIDDFQKSYTEELDTRKDLINELRDLTQEIDDGDMTKRSAVVSRLDELCGQYDPNPAHPFRRLQ